MAFYADLHIHSKYSRATSKNCDLEHLAIWARKKGISLVGSGDFTHPAWNAELKDKLVPAEPGLFRLRPELEKAVEQQLPPACRTSRTTTRFMLSVEISTIYKKGDKTRKIHHLIYTPDFEAADRVIHSLSKIGNLKSDGRPILGLDSRHLLEITLESGPGSYLVPAHIWTPWFAALGSKSGFDAIDACYADLAPHIFAVETGLSSDPPMNWRVSSLDRFRLVSNSDAHSPEKLGREVCVFNTELDYFALRQALETGQGYEGTLEFFPEEGKYHLDGHRSCNVRFSPGETRHHQGRCPACGKPLTVGVMHRVEDLADRREEETPPQTAGSVRSLVPLPEMLSEIYQVGPKSKKISHHYEDLLGRLGPELQLLTTLPLEDIQHASAALVTEAVSRLRKQEVIREAGYDGVYGTIRLFRDAELRRHTGGASLFREEHPSSPTPLVAEGRAVINSPAHIDAPRPQRPARTIPADPPADISTDILAELDADQRRAAEITAGPLLIVAGPGSGKTKTLTHRLAHLITRHAVPPARCLALTFTRRAADELRARLQTLLPDGWRQITVGTFHSLALSILQADWNAAGLQRGFRLASDAERLRLLQDALGVSEKKARSQLSAVSHAKRTRTTPTDGRLNAAYEAYQRQLETRNLLDFDDLVIRAADALASEPTLQADYRQRYQWVCIDEYQDVDEQQVRLIKQLVPADGNICAIGDPDQAIYSFRGADVRFFSEFQHDFPTAQVVRLTRNYRSDRNIVRLSSQLMATASAQHSVPVLEDTPSLITIHEAPTEKAEAEFIVQSLEHTLGGHSFFSIDSGRSADAEGQDVSFSDFAVLYRTETQATALVEALQRSGMPFQKRSHSRLLDHPGVAVLIDTIRQQPQAGAVGDQLEAAYTQLQQAARSASDEVTEAYELLKPIAQACGQDLERFLSELALESQIDSWDSRADRISLLTLHAAKGLEFPVVFIVGCEDGILPLRWGKAGQAKLDDKTNEERRVFYVGVTRAKTKLYLCRAKKRRWRGKIRELPPSPYLADIEEQLLERQRSQIVRKVKKDTQLELFS